MPADVISVSSTVSVRDAGALGNGVTDDTSAIQTAMKNGGTIQFPPGIYLCAQVLVPSNTRIQLDPLAILLKKPLQQSNQQMLYLAGNSGISIEGGTIDGNLANNPNGQCHGIGMAGANRIRIRDIRIINMPGSPGNTGNYGDAVYVGCGASNSPTTDLVIDGLTSDNCNRHGVFFVSVDGAKVVNSRISNLQGNSPGSGINFEPNQSTGATTINNVLISGVEIWGCNSGITAQNHYNVPMDYKGISIKDCTFRNNRTTGMQGGTWGPGWTIDSCRFQDNGGYGLLLASCDHSFALSNSSFSGNLEGFHCNVNEGFSIIGCSFLLNKGHGLSILPSADAYAPHYGSVIGCQAWNNGTGGTGDGFYVWADKVPVQLSMVGNWAGNRQVVGPPTQRYGYNLSNSVYLDGSNQSYQNLTKGSVLVPSGGN